MATVDLSQGSAYEMDSGASARSFVVKRVLDCAKNNLGAGDVAQSSVILSIAITNDGIRRTLG